MELVIGRIYSDYEVRVFVRSIHGKTEDFVEGNLVERIEEFDNYKLEEVSIDKLERGYYEIDDELVDEYSMLDNKTMPPIVLGHLFGDKQDVIDGNHRVEMSVKKNLNKILAFVPCLEK